VARRWSGALLPARVGIGHFVSVVDADAVRLETHASRQYVLSDCRRVCSAASAWRLGVYYRVSTGGTGPIPRNVAVVTFKNMKGWPVGIRTTLEVLMRDRPFAASVLY